MLYFILEIIIIIAHLFPKPQVKPIGQQKGGVERRLGDVRTNSQGNAKVREVVLIQGVAMADLPRLPPSLQHQSQLGIRKQQRKAGLRWEHRNQKMLPQMVA